MTADRLPTDRLRRRVLAAPNRRRIFEAIARSPGIHVRRLSRELRMALGSVEHHLRQLVHHGLVFSHRDGRRRSYYVDGSVDQEDAMVLHALAKPLWADLLTFLALRDGIVTDLAEHCRMPRANVAYHLRRLREIGLVDHERVGRRNVHFATDPRRILRLLPQRLHDVDAAVDPSFQAILERSVQEAGTLPREPDVPEGPAADVAALRPANN